jgi:hypothetical protein
MTYVDRHGQPVPVKRLPPGEAAGARDIARWRGRGLPKKPEVEAERIRMCCERCDEPTEHLLAASPSMLRFKCRRCGLPVSATRPPQQRRTP